MQKISKIESFFNSLNLSWQDLIELLPVGVLLFDENWKISSINKNFIDLFDDSLLIQNLGGINLFSKNYLSDKLPLKELLQLRENNDFEKVLNFKNKNEVQYSLIFKGSPIFSNGVFKGGTIIAEKFQTDNSAGKTINKFENSITNFLSKISNCFLIVSREGTIDAISTNVKANHQEVYGREGEKITNVFSSESETSFNSIFLNTINKQKPNYCTLTYFSDSERVTFKAVLIPILNEVNEVSKVAVLLREKNNIDEDGISHLSDSIKLKEFESFAIANSDGIFKINFHGNITFWADNANDLFDVNEKNILNRFIGNIFPEITQEYFEQIRTKIIKNDSWEGYLLSEVLNDDNLFRVKIISKVHNQKTDLFVYCNKIDKHQQRIISSREEEKLFFKDAVLKSNQMILQANPTGTILFANDKFCDVLKYGNDEIRGKHFNDLIENKYKIKNNLNDIESIVSIKDLQIIPLISKLGKSIEVCISVNISTANSELKYFTIYLRECSLKDKLFLETSHALLYQFAHPVVIVDEEQIIKVNPRFCELFGSEFEADFFNMPISKVVDPNSDFEFREILEKKTVYESQNYITFVKMNGDIVNAKVKKICCSKESSFSVLLLLTEGFKEQELISNSDKIKSKFINLGPFYWSGTYEKDELNVNYIDSAFIKSIGFNYTDSFSQVDFLNEITHPDDIEKVNVELSNVIIDGLERTINYRIINKNGEIVWVSNRVKPESTETRKYNALVGSITDITERSLEKEELKSIIDELDKLNTAKEKFISIISHDLKSPFTSIVGFAELILTDSTLSKDEIIEFVGHIKEASFHTVDLLNGLLDLTKLQTGRIEVEPKIINAHYIANKTVEILSGLAFQKGLSLSASIDKSFYVTADENLIFQVFNNLVANSIKFTPKGGSIEITAKELPEKQRVEFTIKDTGVGIEHEDLEKLFVLDKKFTTLGTDGERGTGLGLSLVHEIIEKHLGQISVKSEIGKGSEFIFTLPISTPSILLIDGNQAERVLYTKLLESITKSIEIIQAETEDDGIALIKEKMPMLVIFEHSLPNMFGDEFIGEIKKAGLYYEPSLMVLTNDFNEVLENSYKDIGVNNVFSKPFELKVFKKQLDKLIGRSE